jgi:hypothetical protein
VALVVCSDQLLLLQTVTSSVAQHSTSNISHHHCSTHYHHHHHHRVPQIECSTTHPGLHTRLLQILLLCQCLFLLAVQMTAALLPALLTSASNWSTLPYKALMILSNTGS